MDRGGHRLRVHPEMICRRAFGHVRILSVRHCVEMNRNERMRVRTTRHRASQIQIDWLHRRSCHEHVHTASRKHVANLEPNREYGLGLIKPGWPGSAEWWMSGIDCECQTLQWVDGIDVRRTANPQREDAVLPYRLIPVDRAAKRNVVAHLRSD